MSPPASAAGRYARNLDELGRRFPELATRLRDLARPLTGIVWNGEDAVDIDLRSGRLYKNDARVFAAEQVANYRAAPPRMCYYVPKNDSFDSMITRRVFNTMTRSLRSHGVETLQHMPLTTPGYLIMLGVGLGHQLAMVVEQLPARTLIIVEPFEEFLVHSLHAIDWVALLERCDQLGIEVRLDCRRPPQQIIGFIEQVFGQHNPIHLDGTVIYTHYSLWELLETRRYLVNEMPRRMVTMGYFEDERKMLQNTATNLQRCDFRLLEGKIRRRGNVPVFLIGAGPSFDEVAPIVRHWRDHAIIITSGSALPAALRHGIIPDYHTEIENSPDQYDKTMFVLNRFADLFPEGKLSGIRLIATSTLNPRVAPLFDEVYFFMRETLSSTTAFASHVVPLRGAAPTVANTSLVAAGCLGFGDVYLFGFDCGWRDGQDHHAKETIYYDADEFRLEEMKASYVLPGNFGGEVQSELVFEWSRNLLQSAISAYRMHRVFNCSDGALIEGATPKVAEALEFDTPIDRPAILRRIRDESRFYAAGEFFHGVDIEPLRHEVNDYVDGVLGIIERALAEDSPFIEVADHIWKLVETVTPNRKVVSAIYFTTMAEIKLAALFVSRIMEEDRRHAVARDFLVDFRALHHDLRHELLTILDEMEGLFAGRLDPVWTKGLPTTPGTSY